MAGYRFCQIFKILDFKFDKKFPTDVFLSIRELSFSVFQKAFCLCKLVCAKIEAKKQEKNWRQKHERDRDEGRAVVYSGQKYEWRICSKEIVKNMCILILLLLHTKWHYNYFQLNTICPFHSGAIFNRFQAENYWYFIKCFFAGG